MPPKFSNNYYHTLISKYPILRIFSFILNATWQYIPIIIENKNNNPNITINIICIINNIF